jgi:Asp-tRNA(Asn)/Glu-tRNA(Gln) amidotransferase A subunit family amidase
VAANLTMCGIGEETGPSTRNPATNESLVGIVATHSLVSRAGIIPASLTRDRAGILCRSVADAATVLSAIAGYDPADPATADSVGHIPAGGYTGFANGPSLKGMRIGVVREFMQVFTKADADSVHIAEQAIAELAKAGAIIIDPGPKGALFADAISDIVPALDAPTLVELSKLTSPVADDVNIRLLADREPPTSGEVLFAMDRYLTGRGDRNIRSVRDLLDHSVFYDHPPIGGVTLPPRARLQTMLRDAKGPDISRWHETRTVLQMLVNKVMADNRLDALVYPTKTIPAPRLAAPVEPALVDGHDFRAPLTPRLSPNAGLPAIVVPAGFTREVYDRIPVRGNGRVSAGELDGPKAVQLPVAIEFLGRAYSEPVLIRIAAAYEQATHHRRPPADFPALSDEP